MVHSGKGGSLREADSRFLITLVDDAKYLDGKYVAFGQVVSGMEVIRDVESLPVSRPKNEPSKKVTIVASGELED